MLVALAGLVAGAMNAIAGGGSFVTLPALMGVGAPALHANATSTVALVPSALASAYAYRAQFAPFAGVSLRAMAAVSIIGGAVGAFALLHTPQKTFDALAPFLVLIGALAFTFGRAAGETLRRHVHIGPRILLACQFALGVYGGYFGGAVGIMMLATWSLMTSADLSTMQASRNLLNAAMNITASAIFVVGGLVVWPMMLALMLGAVVGGYGAARLAARLDPAKARRIVVALVWLIALGFFVKTYA